VEGWAAELEALCRRIAPRFQRVEVRRRAGGFVRGLLAGIERKNSWQLAEQAGAATQMGGSGCSTMPAGTLMRSAMTCAAMSWSTSAILGRCWSSTRPGSSRRAPSRPGSSGRIRARPGGSRTASWGVPGRCQPPGACADRPGAVPAEGWLRIGRAAGRRPSPMRSASAPSRGWPGCCWSGRWTPRSRWPG
jgi:hypothetical protein